MIEMQCPHCGRALQIDDEYAGQSGKCTHCQAAIVVLARKSEPEPLAKPVLSVVAKAEIERRLRAARGAPGANEKESLTKRALGRIAGSAIGITLIVLPFLLFVGGVAVGLKLLPYLILFSILVFLICAFVLLPMAAFAKTRPFASTGLFTASYLFGVTTWLLGLIVTWVLWGGVAVVIGLFICGIGVIPMALLATLLSARWMDFFVLLGCLVLTFGTRMASISITEWD